MRRLTPNVLALALLPVVCAPVMTAAQRRQQVRPASSPSETAPTTVIAERPAVVVERDPEDGATTFKLEPWAVEQNKAARSQLLLSAHARRDAQPAAAASQFVNLTLLSRAPRCRFPAQPDVQLVIDGTPYALKFQPDSSTTATTATLEVVTVFVPKAEGVLWVQSGSEEGGECAESLALTLSPQTFARLASARAASLKIGAASFPLNPAALAALRDLGGKMKP